MYFASEVVVELKVGDFEPGYLGQLAAYVGVVDGELRDPSHQSPTMGVLCNGKNEAIVRDHRNGYCRSLPWPHDSANQVVSRAKRVLSTAGELSPVLKSH